MNSSQDVKSFIQVQVDFRFLLYADCHHPELFLLTAILVSVEAPESLPHLGQIKIFQFSNGMWHFTRSNVLLPLEHETADHLDLKGIFCRSGRALMSCGAKSYNLGLE
jgi:hypothetical protein